MSANDYGSDIAHPSGMRIHADEHRERVAFIG